MAKELTLQQARKNSANFLYIFTEFKINGKWYLNYIDSKHAKIIAGKRANQKKLLALSAEKYLGDLNKYSQYADAVREGFKETYGIEPEQALIDLAAGKEVAGKNWNEGVYGIGAIYTNTFKNIQINDQDVTVDENTGHIYLGGVDITDESKTVYKEVKKQTIPFQLFSKKDYSYIFMSQYNKTKKKYYAQSYSTEDGNKFSATTGSQISSTDAGSLFENIQLGSWDFLEWIKTFLAIFGITIKTDSGTTISESNTLPNQTADGYVQESGLGEAGLILAAVAAGTLIATGGIKLPKKSKK